MMTLLACCKLKGMTASSTSMLPAGSSGCTADSAAAGRTLVLFAIMAIYDAV